MEYLRNIDKQDEFTLRKRILVYDHYSTILKHLQIVHGLVHLYKYSGKMIVPISEEISNFYFMKEEKEKKEKAGLLKLTWLVGELS